MLLALLLAAAMSAAEPAPESSQIPNLSRSEWVVTLIAGAILGLGQLWNRRGTKAVETKTDAQSSVLDDQTRLLGAIAVMVNKSNEELGEVRGEVEKLRAAQEDNDRLTTEEFAAMGETMQGLSAGQARLRATQEQQGHTLVDHGRQIIALTATLSSVQSVVARRSADVAATQGLVDAMNGPNGPVKDGE